MPLKPVTSRSATANADALLCAEGFLGAVVPLQLWTGVAAATSQQLRCGAIYVNAGTVITNVVEFISAAGASITLGRFAIYNNSFSLVASTSNIAALGGSTGWAVGALQAAYTVPASGIYFFGDLWVGTGLPTRVVLNQLGGLGSQSVLPNGTRIDWIQSGLSDLPTTATPATSQGQLAVAFS